MKFFIFSRPYSLHVSVCLTYLLPKICTSGTKDFFYGITSLSVFSYKFFSEADSANWVLTSLDRANCLSAQWWNMLLDRDQTWFSTQIDRPLRCQIRYGERMVVESSGDRKRVISGYCWQRAYSFHVPNMSFPEQDGGKTFYFLAAVVPIKFTFVISAVPRTSAQFSFQILRSQKLLGIVYPHHLRQFVFLTRREKRSKQITSAGGCNCQFISGFIYWGRFYRRSRTQKCINFQPFDSLSDPDAAWN